MFGERVRLTHVAELWVIHRPPQSEFAMPTVTALLGLRYPGNCLYEKMGILLRRPNPTTSIAITLSMGGFTKRGRYIQHLLITLATSFMNRKTTIRNIQEDSPQRQCWALKYPTYTSKVRARCLQSIRHNRSVTNNATHPCALFL